MDTFEFRDAFGDTVRFTRSDKFGFEVRITGPRGGVKFVTVMDKPQANALRWFLVDTNKK